MNSTMDDPDTTGTPLPPAQPKGPDWRHRKPLPPLDPWHRHDTTKSRLKPCAMRVLSLLAAGRQPEPKTAGLTIAALTAVIAGLDGAGLVEARGKRLVITEAGEAVRAGQPRSSARITGSRRAALTCLDDAPASARVLAREIGTTRDAAAKIGRGLVGMGLAEWSEERVEWSITPEGRRALRRQP